MVRGRNLNGYPPLSDIIRQYSRDEVLVIAEIGSSHRGDLSRAKELIDLAAEQGLTAVKTQWIIAEEILHPLTGNVALPGGNIDLFRRFRELERPDEFYAELHAYCKKKKILFLCSAFGQESAGKLIRTGAEIMKIASPELGFHELRNAVLASGIPVIFSTGVKYQDDITAAVSDLTAECYPAENLYGLHCVTSYPAAENEMNVSALVGLTAACKVPFGLSDHSIDPYFIPSLAACVFSSSQNTAGKVFILEKHLTLTNDDGGLDDPIAVQGKDFGLLFTLLGKIRQSAFRNNLRLNHAACSTADTNSAADIRDYAGLCAEIIREAALNCGVGNIFDEGINFNERITAALGDGIKQPSVSEESIYRTTNRSLLAVRDIAQGDLITENNARYLRSEKNLTPGLGMQHWRVIGNARARNPVRNGSGIQLSDLEI